MSVASTPRKDCLAGATPLATSPAEPDRVNAWLAAGLAAAALAAGVFVVQQLDGARYERYSGRLAARTSAVRVPHDAEVEAILAPVGTAVAKGTPLVRLKNTAVSKRLEHARREIAALEKERDQAEASCAVEIEWRKRSIEAEVFETKIQQAAFLQQKLSHEVEQLAWKESDAGSRPQEPVASSKLIDQVGFKPVGRKAERLDAMIKSEAARNGSEVAAAQIELCEQRLVELNAALAAIQDKVRKSIGIELVEQRLVDARETLAGLEATELALTLTAESTGVVGVYGVEPGGHVAAHGTIVHVIDEDRPCLQLEVPSDRIVEFRVGETVDILFPGNVERIGRIEAIPPQTSSTASGTQPVVLVSVVPAGKLWPRLPSGCGVEVLRNRFASREEPGKRSQSK
jgi:multidrug resistance efflux pump